MTGLRMASGTRVLPRRSHWRDRRLWIFQFYGNRQINRRQISGWRACSQSGSGKFALFELCTLRHQSCLAFASSAPFGPLFRRGHRCLLLCVPSVPLPSCSSRPSPRRACRISCRYASTSGVCVEARYDRRTYSRWPSWRTLGTSGACAGRSSNNN